jgi:hypothetical protein
MFVAIVGTILHDIIPAHQSLAVLWCFPTYHSPDLSLCDLTFYIDEEPVEGLQQRCKWL